MAALRSSDVRSLLDYTSWANRQILETAGAVPVEAFTAPSEVTWRNLRGTLVHTLDVERSWRARLQGRPREEWDPDLPEEEFPTVESLAARWSAEDEEMRSWLGSLDDDSMAAVVDLGGANRFPLWYFLMHIVTHSAQQRRDATILLTLAGHAPPEIEFLNFADWLEGRAHRETPAG
jgi:uncharacterized damage-inducible protein DinB